MFKSLFTPKWQHKEAKVRLQAIDALEESSNEEALAQLVLTDSAESVRIAALSRITNSRFLQKLLNEAGSAKSWCEVATRIADLQPDKVDALKVQFGKRSSEWDEGLIAAIKQCTNSDLAEQLLIASNRSDALLEVALSAKTIALKLKAVAEISETGSLQELIKQSPHKQVLQAAKAQLKQLKEKENLKNETQAIAKKTIASLEELSLGRKDHLTPAEYVAKVEVLEKRWQALDKPSILQFENTFQQMRAACQTHIDLLRESLKQAELEEEAISSQTMVCKQLELIFDELSNQSLENIDSQKEALILLSDTWKNATDITSPSPALKGKHSALSDSIVTIFEAWERFNNIYEDLKAQYEVQPNEESSILSWLNNWESLIARLEWPTNVAKPKPLEKLLIGASELKLKVKRHVESRNKNILKLFKKTSTLQGHIRKKNLIAANKLLNYLQFEKEKLTSEDQKRVEERLEPILVELEELRDWHAFATEPKKKSLCEQMESLGDADLAPIQLAEKIHELQESWHELTSSDSTADHVLWDQFKAAADKAYKPCHAYYEQQDKVRSKNLKARIEICKELETLIASTDFSSNELNDEFWKELDKHYSKVTKDWKTHAPVPNNEQKRIQGRFGKSINTLKHVLKKYKQNNLEARHELIAKAAKLQQQEELPQAIETAKNLQSEWQNTGLTFYKADKEAWKSFRAEIDKVFERRAQEKAAFIDNLKLNEELIQSVTKSIDDLSKLEDSELKKSKQDYNSLINKWHKGLQLPKRNAKQLLKAFENSCENYINVFSGIGHREKLNAISKLIQILEKIESAELGNLTISKDELNLNAVNLAKPIINALIERINDAPQVKDVKSNQAQLESLLLESEITLGLDSPEECKEERMQRQLEALEAGIGQSQIKVDGLFLEHFLINWIKCGPIPTENSKSLKDRFNNIVKAAI